MPESRLQVESAHDRGPLFTGNPHRMIGQDGAFSIPMEGQSLWFFGDTLIGQRVPGESLWYPGGKSVGRYDMSGRGSIERMLNNSALLVPGEPGTGGLKNYRYLCDEQGDLLQLIPRRPDEHPDDVRVWCLHGCYLHGRVYLYYITVSMLDSGPMPVNFDLRGSGLAVASPADWRFRRIEHAGSTLWWKADQPQFGTSVLKDEREDRVYLYGVLKDDAGVQKCYLARVSTDNIEELEKYEYLASPEPQWRPQIQAAMHLMQGMPNEMSVSYNPYLDCYLAVHSYDLTGEIVARTAPHPWGPWSRPTALWTVRPHYDKPLPYAPLIYAGKEHPELAEDNGRVLYLTYIEFEEYFPHLIQVRIKRSPR